MTRPGIEPATSRSWGGRSNNWVSTPVIPITGILTSKPRNPVTGIALVCVSASPSTGTHGWPSSGTLISPLWAPGPKGLIAPRWGGGHVIYSLYYTTDLVFEIHYHFFFVWHIYFFPTHPPSGREALFALLDGMHGFITSLLLHINFSQVQTNKLHGHYLLSASVVGGLMSMSQYCPVQPRGHVQTALPNGSGAQVPDPLHGLGAHLLSNWQTRP